jgi:hypothetical protein
LVQTSSNQALATQANLRRCRLCCQLGRRKKCEKGLLGNEADDSSVIGEVVGPLWASGLANEARAGMQRDVGDDSSVR